MVCGVVDATVVVAGGIGDSVGAAVEATDEAAASELGSDFGGSDDSVEVVVEGGAGTLLVVSGFSRLSGGGLWSPGIGLVVDEGSSGLMSLLLGGSLG
jgi:hypothetical protein